MAKEFIPHYKSRRELKNNPTRTSRGYVLVEEIIGDIRPNFNYQNIDWEAYRLLGGPLHQR